MSRTTSSPDAGAHRIKWRLPRLALVFLLGSGLLLAVGAYWWRQAGVRNPPSVAWPDMDPAVAAAIGKARAAVLRSPRDGGTWGNLGMVLSAHGFNGEALPCYEQAEQLDPRNPRWPYLKGILRAWGDAEGAIEDTRRALALWGHAEEAPRLKLAELLQGQGRRDEARAEFQKVVELFPGHPRALLGLARLACEENDLEDALRCLSQVGDNPNCRKARLALLAEIHQRLGNGSAAAQENAAASALASDVPWPDPVTDAVAKLKVGEAADLKRAALLLERDQAEEAAPVLEKAVHDYPNSANAWLLWGRLLVRQNNLPSAEQAFRRAEELDGEVVDVHFYLGVVLSLRGDDQAAVPHFRKATQLRPSHSAAHYNLGQCLKRLGDRGGAREAFRAALGCRPAFAEAHRELGALLAEAGELAAAQAHLREAVQLDPDDASARTLLDQVAWRLAPQGPPSPEGPTRP
jgi:tetratricopeptide (TPR) repeat protein